MTTLERNTDIFATEQMDATPSSGWETLRLFLTNPNGIAGLSLFLLSLFLLHNGKEELSFTSHFSINSSLALCHTHGALYFGYNSLCYKLISRINLLTESHLINFAKNSNFPSVFFRI